jgi:hypothetical protein
MHEMRVSALFRRGKRKELPWAVTYDFNPS